MSTISQRGANFAAFRVDLLTLGLVLRWLFLLVESRSCYSIDVGVKYAAEALILAALAFGCTDYDIGRPCPELAAAAPALDGNRTETQEIVAQDLTFPCDELICVATAGRSGYCSKKCLSDTSCPDGFTCRVVQPVGPFAGEQFCVWKTCSQRSDCGDEHDFCCEEVVGGSPNPNQPLLLCDFSEDGKCGS